MSKPDRDTELDAAVRALKGNPYIQSPDEMNVDIGAACFLNANRVCGSDCAACSDPCAPTAAERCALLSGLSAGIELLQELVQLKRPGRAPTPDIKPPYDPRVGTR